MYVCRKICHLKLAVLPKLYRVHIQLQPNTCSNHIQYTLLLVRRSHCACGLSVEVGSQCGKTALQDTAEDGKCHLCYRERFSAPVSQVCARSNHEREGGDGDNVM